MPKQLNAATVVVCLILSFAPTAARATLTISSDPTSNMSCTSLACLPTAADAVLNVADVTSRLASHNLKIATTGAGADAGDIDIEVALSWSSARVLTLNTHESIKIDQPVSVVGTGRLALTVTHGDLSFGPSGRVKFWDLASSLAINGQAYTLIGNVADLATGIASSPSASFALADNYDASGDAPIHGAAVTTTFLGGFEGLGNSISNLTLSCADCSSSALVGLFGQMNGNVENLGLANISVDAGSATAGALAGAVLHGTLRGDFATGSLAGARSSLAGSGMVGGLVGTLSDGDVIRSHATVAVTTTDTATTITAGGLVGGCGLDSAGRSTISQSYATGNITMLSTGSHIGGGLLGQFADCAIGESFATGAVSGEGNSSVFGGLGGWSSSTASQVSNAYATGAVSGDASNARLGGLLSANYGKIATSYAVGHVSGSGFAGGILQDSFTNPPDIAHTAWDAQTTGQSECIDAWDPNPSGCNGVKTRRLKSRLPAGFKPAIWALDPAKNNGFPYLINNPPPQ